MCIIRDDWIFVHVPKAGGTSIKAAFGAPQPNVSHLPRKALPLDRPAWGILRNPFDLLVTLYFFMWQSPPRHLSRVDPDAVRAMGFKKWLLEANHYLGSEPHVDGRVFTWEAQRYGRDLTYPGLEIIAAETNLAPQQRRPSMWYLEGCDHVVRFEHLEHDFRRVMRKLGTVPPDLPHRNRTHHKPYNWRAEYDVETIEHVRKYFSTDIERGGYEIPDPVYRPRGVKA